MQNRWLAPTEAASVSGLSASTLRALERRGVLQPFRTPAGTAAIAAPTCSP